MSSCFAHRKLYGCMLIDEACAAANNDNLRRYRPLQGLRRSTSSQNGIDWDQYKPEIKSDDSYFIITHSVCSRRQLRELGPHGPHSEMLCFICYANITVEEEELTVRAAMRRLREPTRRPRACTSTAPASAVRR